MTTWDEDVQMWRVEVVNQHGDVLVRWFRSWHRAVRWLNEQDAAERYIQDGDWDVQP